MSQINEAWRVLSDPGRRAVYDATLRGSAETTSATPSGAADRFHASSGREATAMTLDWSASQQRATPARFPWRFMLVLAVVGIAFVLVSAALTKPGTEPAPDNLMNVGSCVDILENGDAKEVLCSASNDGVVAELLPNNSICAQGTELHRDRQGMGDLCVRITGG